MTKLETKLVQVLKVIGVSTGISPEVAAIVKAAIAYAETPPAKKEVKQAEVIEYRERDGEQVPFYGKMVNYSDGPRMSFASFPDSGKVRTFPKWLRIVMAARAAGDFTHGPLPTPQAGNKQLMGDWGFNG